MSFQSFKAYMEHKPSGEAAPISLLGHLKAEGGLIPYSQLADRSGMTFGRYAKAITELRESGFIEVSGEIESAIVRLTPAGAKVAELT